MYVEVRTVCGALEKVFDVVKIEIIEGNIIRFTEECDVFAEISRDKVRSVTVDGSVTSF